LKKNDAVVPSEAVQSLQRVINVDKLSITPAMLQRINVGTVDDFVSVMKNMALTGNILGVTWNEEKISVLTDVPNLVLQFYPEINPGVRVFLHKKEARRYNENFFGNPDGPLIWAGEFEGVQFTKKDLIDFLQTYSSGLPPELLKEIKKTVITERRSEQDEMLDLDGDSTRTTIEESVKTNIPKRFSISMPLIYNLDGTECISAKLDFEVAVAKKTDDYNRPTKQNVFILRCTNGRRALQGMMHQILESISSEIPKYYGARAVEMQGVR
jgi:hypothetical protein